MGNIISIFGKATLILIGLSVLLLIILLLSGNYAVTGFSIGPVELEYITDTPTDTSPITASFTPKTIIGTTSAPISTTTSTLNPTQLITTPLLSTPPPTVDPGLIIFQDDFRDNSMGAWITGPFGQITNNNVAEGSVEINNGRYILDISFKQNEGKWNLLYRDQDIPSFYVFRDFDLSIKVEVPEPSDCDNIDIAISFRIVDIDEDHYSLRFRGDGTFALFARISKTWIPIKRYTDNELINHCEQATSYGVKAIGNRFLIYVNGIMIAEVEDPLSRIMDKGGFAIGARGSVNDFARIYFDDLLITEIQP